MDLTIENILWTWAFARHMSNKWVNFDEIIKYEWGLVVNAIGLEVN